MQSYQSLHFIVQSKNYDRSGKTAESCEEVYKKIMFDTNLLSFKPRENYRVVIYENQREYSQMTGYPLWSGGGAVTTPLGLVLPDEREIKARTAIDTFDPAASLPLFAHEITHLVFNEFMDTFSPDDFDKARWLNEGLATYEEMQFYPEFDRGELLRLTRPLVRQNAFPIRSAVEFKPFHEPVRSVGSYIFRGETRYFTNIDIWYWQVRDLVGFLVEKRGRYNFFVLINDLKQKKGLEDALNDAYPGDWRSLEELEREWKQGLE